MTLQRQTSIASSRPNSERSTTPRAMLLAVALFTSLLMGVHSQDTLRYVTSGDQLQRATTDGVRIIVVTDHLHLASPRDAAGSGPLLTLKDSTEAILGMCSAPPEAESGKLQGPVRPGGCVLTVDGPFLSVSQSSTAARWLSHLYINLNAPAGSFGDPLEGGTAAALVRHQGGDLFMSNCTLNGHNHNIRAVRMSAQPGVISTQLFTDECTFTNFTSDQGAAVFMGDDTSAALHHTTLLHNTVRTKASSKPAPPLGSAVVAGEKCPLLMHDCTFENNLIEASGVTSKPGEPVADTFDLPTDVSDDVAAVSVAESALVYANPQRSVLDNASRKSRKAMHWTPADDFAISNADFKQFTSEITAAVDSELVNVTPVTSLPGADDDAETKQDRYVVTALAALFAGIALTSLVAAAFALHWWRKQRRPSGGKQQSESSGSFQHSLVHGPSSQALTDKAPSNPASGPIHTTPMCHTPDSLAPLSTMSGGPSQVSVSLMSGRNRVPNLYSDAAPVSVHAPAAPVEPPHSGSPPKPAPNTLTASCAVTPLQITLPKFNDSTGAFGTTKTESTHLQAPVASARSGQDSRSMSLTSVGATTAHWQTLEKEKKVLEEALDLLVATGTPFLLQYVMEGPVRWRLGSRGAVQYAKSRLTGEKVAIKFFLDNNAFRCEEAACAVPQLRKGMNSLIMLEAAQKTKLARKPILGDALPACIVYERGEPLTEWCIRTRPDTLAVLNTLCSVAQRVAELHAAGFAHRDIKPANVIWQPRTASWAVTDFGCAAPLGYTTSLTDCRVYVPPETLVQLSGKEERRSVTVTADGDVWALGVVALEALSGSVSAAAFAPVDTPTTATRAINACDTQSSLRSSGPATGNKHGEFVKSRTVSVCDAVHDDHASHVTQQLYTQLSGLDLARDVPDTPASGSSLASALSMLRMRIAACIARDPEQRPSITDVRTAMQHARDELRAVHACRGDANPAARRVPSYDSLLSPSTVVPQGSLSPRPHLSNKQSRSWCAASADASQHNKSSTTGAKTPTYMPVSPDCTHTYDAAVDTPPHMIHACGAESQRTHHTTRSKGKGFPSFAPEVLAAQLTAASNKQGAGSVHACAPKVVARSAQQRSSNDDSSQGSPVLPTPEGLPPLEVTTDGSAADDSPDSPQLRRPSYFKREGLKDTHAAASSDTSSTHSHVDASSISGTQLKIRSKRTPLPTVTSGVPSTGNSFNARTRTAAEALVLAVSSTRCRSPPGLTSRRAEYDTFGTYMHAPHGSSTTRSETSITPVLSPRTQKSTCTGTPLVADTPSGGNTPLSPRSPCGHVQNLESMDYRQQGDTLVSPPSSFEAIEGGVHGLSSTHSPPESFWNGPDTLAVSRQRPQAAACEGEPMGKVMTSLSGGILRPSAFRTITETETSVAFEESTQCTQYTGITINMDTHEFTEDSSVRLGGGNIGVQRPCPTPSFGKRQAIMRECQKPMPRSSSFTNKLMAES